MYVPNRNFLLLVTAVAEAATGVGLLVIPTVVSTLLLGSGEIASQTLFFERVVGAALLCIGVASWLSKSDSQSAALRGQLVGLTIYNGLAAIGGARSFEIGPARQNSAIYQQGRPSGRNLCHRRNRGLLVRGPVGGFRGAIVSCGASVG